MDQDDISSNRPKLSVMKGVIFDIKRFAVHDGPGIRTTVFLKGCPLRCAWCHNPESQGFGVETLQGQAGAVCVGRTVSLDEVIGEIERDTAFYDQSGGGVTFSGGEPLSQPEFVMAALDRCGELDIHRTVDTCGQVPREVLLAAATRTDLFLYDLKLAGADRHQRYTGADVTLIQENLKALCETGVAIRVRIPVIPGINDSAEQMAALGKVIASLPRELPVDLLAYHGAAMDKYPRFGMEPPLPDTPEPTEAEMNTCRLMIDERT
jgi:pyruvate formate lyase activating enzyme